MQSRIIHYSPVTVELLYRIGSTLFDVDRERLLSLDPELFSCLTILMIDALFLSFQSFDGCTRFSSVRSCPSPKSEKGEKERQNNQYF